MSCRGGAVPLDRVLSVEEGEFVGVVAVKGMLGLAAQSSNGGGRAYTINRHNSGDALNTSATVKFSRDNKVRDWALQGPRIPLFSLKPIMDSLYCSAHLLHPSVTWRCCGGGLVTPAPSPMLSLLSSRSSTALRSSFTPSRPR